MATPNPEAAQEFHVLIAGLPRSGKSTGLNNIFDLDLPAGISATPITDNVVSESITRNGISVTVTDTPGLKSADAHKDDKVIRDITRLGLRKDFLLILTMSVNPNSCITQDFCNILKNLTAIFGADIWNWSLVLLTNSDTARNHKQFRADQGKQGYVDYLKGHCTELQKVLARIGVSKRVSTFLEYNDYNQFKNEKLDGIVAIPVGEDSEITTHSLLPFQTWTHNYRWPQLAFMEILKDGKNIPDLDILRSYLIRFRYGKYVVQQNKDKIIQAGVEGAFGGAVAGASTGAKYGARAGSGLGILGMGAGAVAGGAAGMVGGGIACGLGALGVTAAIVYTEAILELEQNDRSK